MEPERIRVPPNAFASRPMPHHLLAMLMQKGVCRRGNHFSSCPMHVEIA